MRRKNTQMTTNILIVSLLLIGVVYALLQTNLQIDGIAKILHNTWDVHFDNIQVNEDSVPIGENDSQATINPENNCKIDFEVTLSLPGDFYEFTVDVVNEGTIDGMIGTLNKTLTINNETVQEVPDYLNYSITYDDGVEIEENHKVSAGTVETYKVRLEFKTDIEELPQAATIVTSLEPQYVQADSSAVEVYHPTRLYNVFAAEYNSGSGLVREYTGEHKDSFTKNGTQKIYHWYGSNDANGTAITNKNNVIFANHCWQMLRTTDTGGVKLIYNGEVENNQCLSTRGMHIGYNAITTQSFDLNYWYGTEFSYDNSTQQFSINGTLEQATWGDSTYEGLIGKYTCRNTNSDGTCEILYLIYSYYNSSKAYAIPIRVNSAYSEFGALPFNIDSTSIAYTGYMYGDVYSSDIIGSTFSNGSTTYAQTFSSDYAQGFVGYGDDVIYDESTGKYTLVNYTATRPSDLSGKYISSYNNTPRTYVYYIAKYVSNEGAYVILLEGGKLASDYNTFIVGDSITDNMNGTYSLNSTTTMTINDLIDNYNDYVHKYTCNGSNTTCTNPRYVTTSSKRGYYYIDAGEKIMISKTRNGLTLTDTLLVRREELINNSNNYSEYKYTCNTDNANCTEETLSIISSYTSTGYRIVNNHYYGSSVTWDGTYYTLVDPIGIENYNNLDNLSTHHYMCIENGMKSCSTVAYIHYYTGTGDIIYITLKNGILSVQSALEEMLTKNTNNSTMKKGIDAWYYHYIYNNYDQYIEDTIFCNDRSITKYAGWNDNGGRTNTKLQFNEYNSSLNLSCTNITDQFSVSNSSAKLTYKVGLISNPEANLFGNGNIRKTGNHYWVASPYAFNTNYGSGRYNSRDGYLNNTSLSTSYGVRPSISLIPGIKYSEGDGSKEHPYIIKTN